MKFGQGQEDKAAAEHRTAQVAAENKAQQEQQQGESEQVKRQQELAQSKSAAEKVQRSVDAGDTDDVEAEVALDPYPAYEDRELSELRSEAESRNVEINRDVEKAHLVAKLRQTEGPTNPAYDLMPLEELRSAAKEKGVELDEEFERAHLVTELRAADTHTH
jgi:hypothetical protein